MIQRKEFGVVISAIIIGLCAGFIAGGNLHFAHKQTGKQPSTEDEWIEEGKKFYPGRHMSVTWSDPSQHTGYVESRINLTPSEKTEWQKMQAERTAVFEKSAALEDRIIRAHGLSENKECYELIGIRWDQTFIFDSVPDNPKWGKPWCGKELEKKRGAAMFRADGTAVKKEW